MTSPLDASRITHIFTDLFGTCFDASGTRKEDRKYYGEQIQPWRDYEQEWNRIGEAVIQPPFPYSQFPDFKRLILPHDWSELPAFDDAVTGIIRLRQKFTVCTMSNFPIWMQVRMCKRSRLAFDGYVDLEVARCYKPFSATYRFAARYMQVSPENCLMVTSNESFGDLEGSVKEGMQSVLVDRTTESDGMAIASFVDLAEVLQAD